VVHAISGVIRKPKQKFFEALRDNECICSQTVDILWKNFSKAMKNYFTNCGQNLDKYPISDTA